MTEIPIYRIPEKTADEQRQDIFDRLKKEAPKFKAINDRFKRSEGLDASLNREKEVSLRIADGLLDRLNAIELETIPTLPEVQTEPAIILGEN